jgi:hypothetical protein
VVSAHAPPDYLRVQSSPVRVSSRTAPRVEKRMHAVAVELDFVQPVGPVRRLLDKLREQFAVEIGLPGADRCHGVGDRRIDPAAA